MDKPQMDKPQEDRTQPSSNYRWFVKTTNKLLPWLLVIQALSYLIPRTGNEGFWTSQQKSCGKFSGSIGGISYRYQSNGKKCDTTAERTTIQGAIEHHLKTADDGPLCKTECLDLTHGGTWNGYLLIGPADGFDSSIYCGPTLSFTSCNNGGQKDFN